MKTKIKVGDRFGRLEVIELGERVKGTTNYFDSVRCDCGTITKRVRRSSLQSGNVLSCGCLSVHNRDYFGERFTKHSLSRTRFYLWWNNQRRTKGNFNEDWQNDFSVVIHDVGMNVVDRMEGDGLKPYRPDRRAPYSATNFALAISDGRSE